MFRFYLYHVCFLLVLALSVLQVGAQALSGTYSFRRQELVAAFTFSPEGKFSFFYSYGAVDREASGTYVLEKGVVRLHSEKEAGKDFRVESKQAGSSYRIQVLREPTHMDGAVMALYTAKGDTLQAVSDKKGLLVLPEKDCGKIWLQHQFFPDILSLIKDDADTERNFEVSMAPDFYALSLKGIELQLEGDTLQCPANYFMPMEGIRFVKQK